MEYYKQLAEVRCKKSASGFIQYALDALEGFVEGLKMQLAIISDMSYLLSWLSTYDIINASH